MTTDRSVVAVLDAAVRDAPDTEALVARSGTLTYRQLDAAVDRVAVALTRLGLGPGQSIAATLPNDLDIVVLFHAAMRLGVCWVGVNRNLAPAEKRYLLDDSGAAMLVCDHETAAQMTSTAPGDEAAWDVLGVAPGDVALGAGVWDTSGRGVTGVVDPGAVAALAYTSGTTGRPKAVMLSQHNLVVPGEVLVATRGYGPGLRKGDCLPLTIVNLLVLSTLLTTQARGTSVLIDRLDCDGIADQIEAGGVTTWNGVPALLSTMADDPAITPHRLRTLDEIWSGGDAISPEIAQRFTAKFGVTISSTYGLSEAPTIVSIDDRDAPFRPGSSGRALPHLRVTVRDGTRTLGPDEVGDIHVQGRDSGPWAGVYRPMLGYRDNPAATAEAIGDGSLRTGDLGFVDGEGFLTIVSRRNAVIIRGGANVYPAEVERVLGDADGVAGCVVLGVPDDRLGERVAAIVEPAEGADGGQATAAALLDRCRAELAAYKVPERIVLTATLPRNSMGKVDRSAAAEMMRQADD